MAQPTPYVPTYVFSDWQTANPSDPLPADSLDIQLSSISTFAQQVAANLAIIQRDDGRLANGIVTIDSLASSLAVLMALDKYVIKGAWVTATVYAVGDVVSTATGTYVAAAAHTSGVFDTDYTAGKWLLLATAGAATASSFTATGSSVPANGMYLPSADVLGFAAASLDVLRLSSVTSAVNYFRMQNSAGSDALQLLAQGTATNLDIQLTPKGTGRVLAPEMILTAPLAVAQGGTGSTTASAARTALGAGAIGSTLFTAATTSAARGTLGAGATGDALFTAATAAAARTTLGSSATGDAVFTAASASAARATLGAAASGTNTDITSLDGPDLGAATADSINGAEIDDLAWTPYTPVVTAQGGTFTSVSAAGAYKQIGKTVHIRVGVTITTNGTANTGILATLPVAAAAGIRFALAGRETAVTGFGLVGDIGTTSSTQVLIRRYDNVYSGANGHIAVVTGTYEAA